jgi:ATP/maltotriose-dependent transcriptional regulator MalT/two-component SAPR family response regulator
MSAPDILLSKTKIIVPKRRAELLTRQRLLNALYEILDRRLVMVSAPAGYGKTSLLIDLASHSDLPFCWLALDALDRDPQRFIAYFIAAIAERFPDFGNRSRSALNGLTDLEAGMESVLVTLINEIYDEIHEHFLLVLDDFHLVDDIKPVIYFVNRFIQLADENCHLILSSRSLSELPDLTLLVAREHVGGLSFSDLSFRQEEIQALLAQNEQIHLSDEDARKLAEATEGWVTGLQFIDLSLIQDGQVNHASPSAVLGVNVFDYLGKQVLERQPKSLQLFLLRSSLLEEFDTTLCDAVLASFYPTRQDWSKWMDLIVRRNLFALPIGVNGQWLRYHHLFRDFLQQQLREKYPQEVPIILKRRAQFHEAHGEWEKAYPLYKQLGDSAALVHLIEQAGIPLYQHAMLTLESWLKELPPSVVRGHPPLLSLKGLIETLKGNGAEGIRLFGEAIEKFREQKDTYGLALTLVRRGNTHRQWGNYDHAFSDADEAMKITAADDALQWIYADALHIKGSSLYRLGKISEASTYLESALDISVRLKDTFTIPLLLMETGLIYAENGEYAKGRNSLEKALEIGKEMGNLFLQADILNNLGFVHHKHGDYEQAAQALEEGLLTARQGGYKRGEALILISLGDLYAELEDFEIAEQNYRRAKELALRLGARFFINYLALAEFNLALLKKEMERAKTASKQCSELMEGKNSYYENGLYQLLQARLFLLDAKPREAVNELTKAGQCFNQDGRPAGIVLSHVWMAAAQNQVGERSAALEEIRTVLAESNGINNLVILAVHQSREWLEGLNDDLQARQTLRNLFKKEESFSTQLPGIKRQMHRLARAVEVPSSKLIIRAFGPGSVQVNDKTLVLKDWQTQSVREMFYYFLSLERPVTREQIEAALWAGTEEPVKLHLRFKNDIYRLRRALGEDVILYKDNRYQFNSAMDHDYDVEAFEAFIAKAKSSSRPEEKIGFYQKAVELVRGNYLEDIGAIWVLPEREKLEQAYLEASLAFGEILLSQGQTTDALKTCEGILEHNPASEAPYRLQMRVYHRLGDKGLVTRTYKTCERVMRETYNLPPSEETQTLYRKLTA